MAREAPPLSDHDPWAPVRAHIAEEVSRRLSALGISVAPAAVGQEFASPPEGMGDLALPLFRWAKQVGLKPAEVGGKLSHDFPLGEGLSRVELAGGFLNFHVKAEWLLSRTLGSIRELGDAYGHLPSTGEKVCVEHTSTNPTGAMHVGRARNGIVGDTYARVLRAAGHDVTVQFYVDDIGRQAATLAWIWSKPVEEWPPEIRDRSGIVPGVARPPDLKPDAWLGKPYPSASELVAKSPDIAQEVSKFVNRFERKEIPAEEYRRVPREVLEGTKMTLGRVGIRFDEFVWESDFILDGSVERVVERVAQSSSARRQEGGALALDATGKGLPETESIILVTRSDGSSLYVARDVAYHLQKLARFGRVIDVLGEDHKLHFRTLVAILEILGEKRLPEVFTYSFVSLPEGKMSTRAGRVVTMDELLDEARERALAEVRKRRPDYSEEAIQHVAESVGTGAVRFHLLAVQPDKSIVFRWEEALAFEGRSAPFVQYAHARAASLLRKAEESEPEATRLARSSPQVPPPGEPDPRELALVRTLSRFPSLVGRVAESGSVHLLALYPHELAERLNEYYQAVRILGGAATWLPWRISLIAASRQVLHNSLELIGVEPLERM